MFIFLGLVIANLSVFPHLGGASDRPFLPVNSDQRPFLFQMKGDEVTFEGGFRVNADPEVVAEVLKDFDHYDRFVPDRQVRVLRSSGAIWVQEKILAQGDALASQRCRLVLRVEKSEEGLLQLQDELHQNFDRYQETWTWKALPKVHQVRVSCRLSAEEDGSAEGYLDRNVFQGRLDSLLSHMALEMERRQNQRKLD